MVADATEILAMESTAACDVQTLVDIAFAVRELHYKNRYGAAPSPARAVLLRDYESMLWERIGQLERKAEQEGIERAGDPA